MQLSTDMWLEGLNNVIVPWERLVQVLRQTQLNQLATLVENGLQYDTLFTAQLIVYTCTSIILY